MHPQNLAKSLKSGMLTNFSKMFGDEDFKLRKQLFYRNTPLIPTVISKFSAYSAEKPSSVNNVKKEKASVNKSTLAFCSRN